MLSLLQAQLITVQQYLSAARGDRPSSNQIPTQPQQQIPQQQLPPQQVQPLQVQPLQVPSHQPSAPTEKPSTIDNLKSAAAGIHGAGETLRGTLNSTVDKHFGANPKAMDKNQAAIDAGRYEIENRMFYHPNEYRPQDPVAPVPPVEAAGADRRESRRSKFGNLFKGSSHGSSSGDQPASPPPERARLRKRSSSRFSGTGLSVVGE
ncbi:hypothetical protein NM208_g11671 [Fusarium decemcellulare]|uniref:Uncharacterized protein n=1 Tax=Fusarium decemcellulare TaxID=57161 RepID=A0ACC1RRP8_9HYPO|nr:hypothetical protein NM208_g11671 [Fusarium decemcellulare]